MVTRTRIELVFSAWEADVLAAWLTGHKMKVLYTQPLFFNKKKEGVGIALFSRAASSQVSSAPVSLTTVFGMGTGGSSPSLTPTLPFIQDAYTSYIPPVKAYLQNRITHLYSSDSKKLFKFLYPSFSLCFEPCFGQALDLLVSVN